MQECYFSGAGNGSLCYELYDKSRLQPDIKVIANVADEMVNAMGQKVEYWVNTMELSSADLLYGEQPTSVYYGPKIVKMIINLNESNLSLSKFGFNADDDITGYMSFYTFVSAMSNDDIYTRLNQDIEPKSGDVFKMTEYGQDRKNGREGNFFQITQRRDQDIGDNMNLLGGHYGWQIKAKRLEYSFEPGLPQEKLNVQSNDDSFYGKLVSTISGEISSTDNSYGQSADEQSKHFIIDMTYNNTSVYGTYDLKSTEEIVPARATHILDVVDQEELINNITEEKIKELEQFIDLENYIRMGKDVVDGGSF